jgi:ferredoxin--NADP+ reductase
MTMAQLGTETQALRIAIIGSGPSGFYAAEYLQKQPLNIEIDMLERLPTPFGLVRGGVAPDHQKIKNVTKVYDRIAQHPKFRFFGNLTFGKDIFRADLQKHYHAVIYTVGSSSDRRLGIAGEDLEGSFPATEFVGWYNAHPDYRHLDFDLSVEAVAVIGVGNVAMDVTRILARSQAELNETDIAAYAQEALAKSNIKRIYVMGRRGPAQAAFTNPEIKELGEMADADIFVFQRDVVLDEASKTYLASDAAEKKDAKNVEILQEFANRKAIGKPKQIVMRFLTSPVEIIGTDKVEAIKVVRNELYTDERGNVRPRETDETEIIPVGLVFRSVGYMGLPLPDVPFHEKGGIIPNREGRVMIAIDSNEQVIGDYVAGWIKRGPSGIIGTNKPDSVETAQKLLEDIEAGKHWTPDSDGAAILKLIQSRKPDYVTYQDWLLIDQIEIERGQAQGRPRLKFTDVSEMLSALAEAKRSLAAGD